MSPRIYIVGILAIMFLTSCSGDISITGQIFIVTQGHESVKLGLVEIAAIPAELMTKQLEGSAAEMSRLRSRLSALSPKFARLGIPETMDWLDVATKLNNDDYKQYGALRSEREDILQSLRDLSAVRPAPVAVTKSDADGNFCLTLPKHGQYFLTARAERNILGRTEQYSWCFSVDSRVDSQRKIHLSNDNLIEDRL